MRIFIAGATGAVGIRVVRLLAAAGHFVVGTTRTPEKEDLIRSVGGQAIVVDGLNAHAVRGAVAAAKPDVIIHEMTALSGGELQHFDRTFALTNRLRTEGLNHLLAAAKEFGVRRLIAQSYCGWPYARSGATVKNEDNDLDPDPPRELQSSLNAIRYLETTLLGAAGIEGLALRYGAFYGPHTGMLESSVLIQLRHRRFPLIGDGNGWWSFVHVDDAAGATARATDHGARGIYNIVDDDPAPVREWLPALATLVDAKPPLRVPKWLGRLLAGDHLVKMMTEVRAGSNAKAKSTLGWRPLHSSWREGFATSI
ncbi:MAG TPA: NAD(P)-dependent oxidoreductase [Steroidobacteraceae bacterium]